MQNGFATIPIKKFLTGKNSPVDLYISLENEKFIKVVNAGDEFDKQRLNNYANHKVRDLHIKASDVANYINYCVEVALKILEGPINTSGMDTTTVCRIGELFFMDVKLRGLNADTQLQADNYLDVSSQLLMRKTSLHRMTLEILAVDCPLTRLGIGTAFITLILLFGMRWKSIQNIKTLFTASLLLDVGLLSCPELLEKNSLEMSPDEQLLYRTHPEASRDILLKNNIIKDEKIHQIVLQHHELPDGTGFPCKLISSWIHPMALPVIMSSRLAEIIFNKNSPLKERSLAAATKFLYLREARNYPAVYWDGLKSWQAQQ